MSNWSAFLFVVVALIAAAIPGAAEACAVCFQAKTDASRVAFIASTAAMTGMPLILIGSVTWWVRKRFRDAREADLGAAGCGDR